MYIYAHRQAHFLNSINIFEFGFLGLGLLTGLLIHQAWFQTFSKILSMSNKMYITIEKCTKFQLKSVPVIDAWFCSFITAKRKINDNYEYQTRNHIKIFPGGPFTASNSQGSAPKPPVQQKNMLSPYNRSRSKVWTLFTSGRRNISGSHNQGPTLRQLQPWETEARPSDGRLPSKECREASPGLHKQTMKKIDI